VTVRFCYEWHDDEANWFRSYGNELWECDENGLVRVRQASINDVSIREEVRKFHWDRSRPRPADHPGLSDLVDRGVTDSSDLAYSLVAANWTA
jgi:nuclear transport factor 2 (NTF2) superfamily protein